MFSGESGERGQEVRAEVPFDADGVKACSCGHADMATWTQQPRGTRSGSRVSSVQVLSAFPAMVPQWEGADTVLTGRLDRSALFGVLAEGKPSASTCWRSASSHRDAPQTNQTTTAHRNVA